MAAWEVEEEGEGGEGGRGHSRSLRGGPRAPPRRHHRHYLDRTPACLWTLEDIQPSSSLSMLYSLGDKMDGFALA